MFKKIRVLILLAILLSVGLTAWREKTRSTEWKNTLFVTVYPINAEGSDTTERYIQGLEAENFDPIEAFLSSESDRYGLKISRPVDFSLGPRMKEAPPELSGGNSVFSAITWSLKLRYWAWSKTPKTSLKPSIRLYVIYHDPAVTDRVPHSVGLQQGQIGVIHAFASKRMNGSNLVVIGHEFLHTLGASDKYGLHSGLPSWPDGYAEPQRQPRYPQQEAEIMGGRIPISESQAEIPSSLSQTLIGPLTAHEIGWTSATP